MAKNKKTPQHNTEKEKDYYKLNTKAVDRLVNANKISTSQSRRMKDPAKQYRSGFLDRIPAPVKALFIKFWFNGAVCYFIFWGLGSIVTNYLDMIFVLAIVLGMVTDIFVNNALRFVETLPGENDKWMMFPQKKYWTFIANIFYAFLVLTCVIWMYEGLRISVEPVLFGIFYMIIDLWFVGMKNLTKLIIKDAINKVNKK